MHVLITGGAGFIGSNASLYYLNNGHMVTILDNFSRAGSKLNVEWLIKNSKNEPKIIAEDLRSFTSSLKNVVKKSDLILHLAGQVAVTNSVINPREDFESNALGTFNLLEAVRVSGNNPVIIYSSTNKVYGDLGNVGIVEEKTRYVFRDKAFGVSEEQNVDFHSPYGCSKGAADQYVRDYSRIYNLNTIVFRQSCIYGPRQFGIEDQGWLAWFIIAIMNNKPITIYGNGKQVRDVLYVDDLISAYNSAFINIKKTKGQIYNIGGGMKNTLSVWIEFKLLLEKFFQKEIKVSFSETRPGDQPIYISDIRKAWKHFSWKPEVTVEKGTEKIFKWVQENKIFFEEKA